MLSARPASRLQEEAGQSHVTLRGSGEFATTSRPHRSVVDQSAEERLVNILGVFHDGQDWEGSLPPDSDGQGGA